MMRGTVYLFDSQGVLRGRAVLTFEVGSADEFQRYARLAYEPRHLYRFEFGPIGPPWRVSR